MHERRGVLSEDMEDALECMNYQRVVLEESEENTDQ